MIQECELAGRIGTMPGGAAGLGFLRATPSDLDSAESLVRRCHEADERASHLDRVNRDLSRFAADTAHDLRSPLQVISGFAQLIARRDGHRLGEDSQRGLAVIIAAVNDMAEMIDSALAQAPPVRAIAAAPRATAPTPPGASGVQQGFRVPTAEG